MWEKGLRWIIKSVFAIGEEVTMHCRFKAVFTVRPGETINRSTLALHWLFPLNKSPLLSPFPAPMLTGCFSRSISHPFLTKLIWEQSSCQHSSLGRVKANVPSTMYLYTLPLSAFRCTFPKVAVWVGVQRQENMDTDIVLIDSQPRECV